MNISQFRGKFRRLFRSQQKFHRCRKHRPRVWIFPFFSFFFFSILSLFRFCTVMLILLPHRKFTRALKNREACMFQRWFFQNFRNRCELRTGSIHIFLKYLFSLSLCLSLFGLFTICSGKICPCPFSSFSIFSLLLHLPLFFVLSCFASIYKV